MDTNEMYVKKNKPTDVALSFLKRVTTQAEFSTKNGNLVNAIERLGVGLTIGDSSAKKVQDMRRKLDLYKISRFHLELISKSLRHLESLVTPLERLKEINLRKKQIAVAVSNEIVENTSIKNSILAIILDGTVSQEIAVEDSDIDIAIVVSNSFGKKTGVRDDSQHKSKLEQSVCAILNSKNLGVIVHDNMVATYNNGGVHLRVISESDLDMGRVTGAGPTARDGLVLYEKEGFSVKDI